MIATTYQNTTPLYQCLDNLPDDIKGSARSVFSAIVCFIGKNPYCWASNQQIAKRAGLSVRQAQRYIRKLVADGHLFSETHQGRRTNYSLKPENLPHYIPEAVPAAPVAPECRTPAPKASQTHDIHDTQKIKFKHINQTTTTQSNHEQQTTTNDCSSNWENKLVKGLSVEAQETVLNEFRAIKKQKVIHNPKGYLATLVRRFKDGSLIPVYAEQQRKARERRAIEEQERRERLARERVAARPERKNSAVAEDALTLLRRKFSITRR